MRDLNKLAKKLEINFIFGMKESKQKYACIKIHVFDASFCCVFILRVKRVGKLAFTLSRVIYVSHLVFEFFRV